jgi:hypothetical protein
MSNITFTKFDPFLGKSVPMLLGESVYEQQMPMMRKKKRRRGLSPEMALGNLAQDVMNQDGVPGIMSSRDKRAFGADVLGAVSQDPEAFLKAGAPRKMGPPAGMPAPKMPQMGAAAGAPAPKMPGGAGANPLAAMMGAMGGGTQQQADPAGMEVPKIAAARVKREEPAPSIQGNVVQMPAGGPRVPGAPSPLPAGAAPAGANPLAAMMGAMGGGQPQQPQEIELWDAYSGEKKKFVKGDPNAGVQGVRGRKDINRDEAAGFQMALGKWRTEQPSGGVNPNEYVMAYGVVPEKVRGLSPQELPATQEMEDMQMKQQQNVQALGGDGKDGPEYFTTDPNNQGAPVETPEGMGGVVDEIENIYKMQQELGGNVGEMIRGMQQQRQAAQQMQQQGGMPGGMPGQPAPQKLAAGAVPAAGGEEQPAGVGPNVQAMMQAMAQGGAPQMPQRQMPQMPAGRGDRRRRRMTSSY